MVEEFASAAGGDAAYFLNAVSELALGPGAKVTHAVVQQQSRRCVHLQSTFVVQAATSDYALTDVALGARLGRHEVGALYDAALGSGFGFPVEQALQITNSCCSWLCFRGGGSRGEQSEATSRPSHGTFGATRQPATSMAGVDFSRCHNVPQGPRGRVLPPSTAPRG